MSFGLSNHTVLCYISHTNVGNAFAYFKHDLSEIVVLRQVDQSSFRLSWCSFFTSSDYVMHVSAWF